MENPEKLATLDTPDRNKDKQGEKHTAQYRKLKMTNTDPTPGMNPGAHDEKAVPASYRMLLI